MRRIVAILLASKESQESQALLASLALYNNLNDNGDTVLVTTDAMCSPLSK